MTNTLAIIGVSIVTVVTTNWQNIPGDFKRDTGTNYTRQQLVVTTNIYAEEVVLCTNRTFIRQTKSNDTNAPTRWHQVTLLTPPPLPGQMEKP